MATKSIFGDFMSSLTAGSINYNVSNLALIKIEGLNDTKDSPFLITRFVAVDRERIQSVPCFDNKTYYYHFGPEATAIQIDGIVPATKFKEIKDFYDGSKKGTSIRITASTIVFEGYLHSMTYQVSAETAAFYNVSMELIRKLDGNN